MPDRTRKNGTLFVHCFLLPNDANNVEKPFDARWYMVQSAQLTQYMVPEAATFQLMGDEVKTKVDAKKKNIPATHLRSVIPLSVVNEALSFDWKEIPGEIARLLRVNENQFYYPILYLDELSFRVKVRLFSYEEYTIMAWFLV